MQDLQMFVEMGLLGGITAFECTCQLCTLNPALVHDVYYVHLKLPLSQLKYVSCFNVIFVCKQDCHFLYINAIGL